MWMLIRRELDNMVTINLRRSFQAYIIFGLVFVLFMWLLGPRVIGYFEAEMFSLFVLWLVCCRLLRVCSLLLKKMMRNGKYRFYRPYRFEKGILSMRNFLAFFGLRIHVYLGVRP